MPGWSRDEVQTKALRLPAALHSWSQTVLGIPRVAPVLSPFVWEMTKGLQWETLAPDSTPLALTPNTPAPVLGVRRQQESGGPLL